MAWEERGPCCISPKLLCTIPEKYDEESKQPWNKRAAKTSKQAFMHESLATAENEKYFGVVGKGGPSNKKRRIPAAAVLHAYARNKFFLVLSAKKKNAEDEH